MPKGLGNPSNISSENRSLANQEAGKGFSHYIRFASNRAMNPNSNAFDADAFSIITTTR